jgi:cytochrome c5
MKLKQLFFALCLLLFSASLAETLSQNVPAASTSASKHPTAQAPGKTGDDGQRVFEANCSRCHNTPEGFPPRISGTVVKHMRVRASLSRQDEEALLRFLNP